MLKTAMSACVCAVLAMSAPASAQAPTPTQRSEDDRTTAPQLDPVLVGSWRSAPDEMALTTAFDESVWGRNARSVRTVELQVEPDGDGTLRVTKKVVDARGRTVAASTSIERAALRVGGSRTNASGRTEHDVQVVSAERTYPDDPGYKWDLAGLRVQIATFDEEDANRLEVRFDTPAGTGSFWETLRRQGRGPSGRQRIERAPARPIGTAGS